MLFESTHSDFNLLFKTKLSQMLSPDELGTFILVLFNSMQESDLQESLAPQLETTFNALKNNPNLSSAPDDMDVFEALKNTGISHYRAWQTRQLEHWRCAYNPLRALRPERASKEQFSGLQRPFNEDGFHFSKPFLKPEILSEELFTNTPLKIMYHKFPFAPYHLLIVVEADKHHPQYLDQKTHQLSWELASHVENNINGFGLAFNSLGAGASVNQLHIHGFVDNQPLSIEQGSWQHNGGSDQYPLNVTPFHSVEDSWALIDKFHQQKQPYNLLYRTGVCYVIQRKPQGSVDLPDWLPSIGWYEACGGFNLSDENYYQNLTADNIHKALLSYR